MSLKVSPFSITKTKDLAVAVQIAAPNRESTSPGGSPSNDLTPQSPVPDPELPDSSAHLHITPVINDDEDFSNPGLLSDSPSDIKEESELIKYAQILKEAQMAELKRETTRKRGVYLKNSKQTLQRRKQVRVELSAKGFLPVDEFIRQKKISTKRDGLTPCNIDN